MLGRSIKCSDSYILYYLPHICGRADALNHLLQKVKEWVNLGMPCAASFTLQIYPITSSLKVRKNQWIVKRKDSQFLWCLNV